MSPSPVLIAADHAGAALKAALIQALPNWKWIDLGPAVGPGGKTARVDYPDFAAELGRKIQNGVAPWGVLVCGSGIGMSIAANKLVGIRAAVVENPTAARLAREHNHANVLCLGARFLAAEYAAEIALAFLQTPFSQDARHVARVAKIEELSP